MMILFARSEMMLINLNNQEKMQANIRNHKHDRCETEKERNGPLNSVHKSTIVDGGATANGVGVCECLPSKMRKNHFKYFLIQAESVEHNFSAR